MRTRICFLLTLMLALALALAACTSNGESDAVTSADPAPTDTPGVVSADDTPPDTGDAVSEATPELGSVDTPKPPAPTDADVDVSVDLSPDGIFEGATAALEALDSYRFITTFLFTGEEDGDVESGSIELTGAIMDSDHKHYIWRDLEEGEQFEIIQLENQAWVYDEDGWEEVPSLVADAMSQAVLIFAPSIAWGGVFGGLDTQSSYVGLEIVDGVSAHHYTSTVQQWGGYWQGEVLDATGDVWIAEAGYPVRYDFTATGIDEDGDRGSISWTMELTDVGEDIIIVPPL